LKNELFRVYKALISIRLRALLRTLGFPIKGFYSPKRFLLSIFMLFLYLFALFYLSPRITPQMKLFLLNLLFYRWFAVFLSFMVLGNLIGISWSKIEELDEIMFLKITPIPRSTITCYRIIALSIELFFSLLLIYPFLIPWGRIDNYSLLFLKLLFVSFVSMCGLVAGLFISVVILRLFFTKPFLRKVFPYIIALFLYYISFKIPEILPLSDVPILWIMYILVFLLIFSIMVRISSIYLVNLLEIPLLENYKIREDNNLLVSERWGGFIKAVAKKDLILYLRDMHQFLRTLLILAVIIIIWSQSKLSNENLIKTFLFTVPYGFSDIIAIHLVGNDGILIAVLKMLKGTLKDYLIARIFLSYLFVLIPTITGYLTLSFIFLPKVINLTYLLIIIVITFIYVLLATGISVLFRQKREGNPYAQLIGGTSLMGQAFYWIIGIGLPIMIGYWTPGMNIFDIPLKLILMGSMTLIATFIVLILSFYYIDKIDV